MVKYPITLIDSSVKDIHSAIFYNERPVIHRTLIAPQMGNFNPLFCRYKGKTYLVKSLDGDLSDPFRREEEYARSLYINTDKPCEFNL